MSFSGPLQHRPPRPRWSCHAGTVIGWYDGEVARATGIRYATADRFTEPSPEPPRRGPMLATSWAPACPQNAVPLLDAAVGDTISGVKVDEDCLRLSVTVPADAGPDERLPVMVWIHGGSYHSGAGDTPFYDPVPLVREQRVVFVAVTYRLGLFGFLGHGTVPANLGLLDQIEALRWVQSNIAAFGGDPDAVTVFGESAGGDSVAHLMVAEGAEGLFCRAIMQSAPFGIVRGRDAMYDVMARRAAAIPPRASAAEVVASEEEVVAGLGRFGLAGGMPFGLRHGHHPLPAEDQLDAAWERAATRVEVLVGSNLRETALFTLAVPGLAAALAAPVVRRAVEAALVRPLTRRIYAEGARTFARRHGLAGGRGYRYVFSWATPGNPFAACHVGELPLLFGNEAAWSGARILGGTPWAEVDAAGRLLRGVWAEFARTGRIAGGSLPGLLDLDPITP